MLYLNEKPWDKSEWNKILVKYFNQKNYKKKQFEFKLTDRYFGTKKVNNENRPTCPPAMNIDMRYTITLDGEDVTIRYAETPSYTRAGKENAAIKVDDLGKIVFENGFLRFDVKKLDLYLFLLISPNNYTNPMYYMPDKLTKIKDFPTTANFIFKEMNEELAQADIYDTQKIANDARNYIFNQMTEAEARELYVKVYEMADEEEGANAPLKKIKNLLLVEAGSNPKQFMENLDNEVRTMKGKIVEAKNANVIHFDIKKGWWMWSGKGGGKIISVAKGKDPLTELVRWANEKDSGSFMEALDGKIIAAEAEVVE